MQGQLHPHHHHLQQQLAALLSAALPQPANTSATAASSSSESAVASLSVGSEGPLDDAARVAALNSLHRILLYPPSTLLITHSAPFLSQGLSQLLSDKSYTVRRSAAVTFASLCAVISSDPPTSNGLVNHQVTVDRFISWALPLLGDIGVVGNGSAELALEGIREFLTMGDAERIEHYVPSILKACRELLEDERTSLSLLRLLLPLMNLISARFERCFQPHFADVVDLLLGWAFMPNLSEPDRCIISDSFLLFRNHWLGNIPFSLGLLSKFLGDIEVLIQDAIMEPEQQLGRLVPLFSCFSSVLQVVASEIEHISGPIESMAPRLLRCILIFGSKFGWSKYTAESWRCLILLAETLEEKFFVFFPVAMDNLFSSMRGSPSAQLHGMLKINLQLLSQQNLALIPSAVRCMLQFDSPLSQLRLHPNHLVVATAASTYLCFLRHSCDGVAFQAILSLEEELEMLGNKLGKIYGHTVRVDAIQVDTLPEQRTQEHTGSRKLYSGLEFISLMKFDFKVMLSSVSCITVGSLPDTSYCERLERASSFLLEKLNPFKSPIQRCTEIQAHVLQTLHKLGEAELLSKVAICEASWKRRFSDSGGEIQRDSAAKREFCLLTLEYLKKYSGFMFGALKASTPVTLKFDSLEWISSFCLAVLKMKKKLDFITAIGDLFPCIRGKLLFSVLDAAYDRELKVRSRVAWILELLLQAGLVHTEDLYSVSEVTLDKLGDPDTSVKIAFTRVLSISLPITVYVHGLLEDGGGFCKIDLKRMDTKAYTIWKQAFTFEQSPCALHSYQLVSVLSYISQRSKVPLSSWIQRLIFSCHGKQDISSCNQGGGYIGACAMWKDTSIEGGLLYEICSVNNLAAVWWSIHEAARHCITLRLRTNLGGPTQTFAALEHMLLEIPNVLLLDAEQTASKYIKGSSNVHLLPMRLLLEFVEALKKNVYNAYEGSYVLPCSPQQSSLFFRANKKVCEEWFCRICDPMMNASLALHFHDATSHYCALQLQDLSSLVASTFKDKIRGAPGADNLQNLRTRIAGDILRILRHAALALCRTREPDALAGLQKWTTISFPSLFLEENQMISDLKGRFEPFPWMTGLIYQAQGQYEKAAAHFSNMLQSEEELSSLGSDGIQFIIARVIENYALLSDWKSLEIWLAELQALRSLHAGKVYSGALTAAGNEINAIQALARFDEGDIQAAWGYLDLTPKCSNELTLDPKVALERSEQMLLRSMLHRAERTGIVLEELEKAKSMVDEALSVAPLGEFSEAAAFSAQLHCAFALEEGNESGGQDEARNSPSILDSLHQVLHNPMSKVRQDCSLWVKVFRAYRTFIPTAPQTSLLCQKLLSLARKQSNFMLADRMCQYLRSHQIACTGGKRMELLAESLEYESILLDYAKGKHEEALMNLWSFVRPNMLSTTSFASETGTVLKAKACLKFSTLLRQDSLLTGLRNVMPMVCKDFSKCRMWDGSPFLGVNFSFDDYNLDSNSSLNVILEEMIGTAVKLSCYLCPAMSKTWLSYASWCFAQARGSLLVPVAALQSLSFSPVLQQEIIADRFKLTEEERSRVETIVRKFCLGGGDMNIENVAEEGLGSKTYSVDEALVNYLVQQAAYLIETAAGAPGVEDSDSECPSAALTSQFQKLFVHSNVATKNDLMSSANEFIDVWWSIRKRRVSLFGHAAHGYFQYLSYSCSKHQDKHNASYGLCVMDKKAGSCNMRVMLYILHILLNYGVELYDVLERGLATVPLIPWQEITPQLFARLSSHPRQLVRELLERLLMMLAKLSPWSIVYPTLVDINGSEREPSEELQRLSDCLGKLYPELIQDAQLVINDLSMITFLWEEQWLSTLQDLRTDVIRRINLLKEEAARVAENFTLSPGEKDKINAAKYSAMMAPIIVALERRLTSTSRQPETVHEIWFQKEYKEQLKSAILAFRTPPGSVTALGDVWQPFDTIAASLAAYQRKSSILLNEVAPNLAQLSSSNVPMPGLEKETSGLESTEGCTTSIQGIVTISSFCEKVTILSTKTRPKKLIFFGSDGQKYTYLLKGREDLRLDARIMQLLQAVNSFMYSCTDAQSRSLAIRYYSVTPISGRAGLIQWVDNVTSIYNVFRSWQSRFQLSELSAIGGDNTNIPVPLVPRPSDMFYGKIIPALKEKGIRRVISRRDWPHEVKRKVLLDLMKETPRQLLWQEMWCSSEGFKAFNRKAKRFSHSVAAMSMVGHILGLGDRHLDNILMDFSSGDIVHIDYNICFDKGKRLKIPEIVPFRLTQTIEAALGLTGTEGTFRASCEAIIRALQKNKDLILMLLEVFVWDPLVEWMRGDYYDEAAIGGEEKKGMELAVGLSLFASRVQEIRVQLQEHHDLLLATLPAAESALKNFWYALNQYEVVSAVFSRADKERSNLLQLETSAKSIVAEATSVSEKAMASYETQAREFGRAKSMAAEKAEEAAMWVDQHRSVLDALRSGRIPDSRACVRLSSSEEVLSLTSAVLVSGVPLTVVPEPTQAQCHELDREVLHLFAELDDGLTCAVKAIHEYALALQAVLPPNYISTSPLNGWAQVLQLSVNTTSPDTLSLSKIQAADLIFNAQGQCFDSIKQAHWDLFCKMERYAIEIEKVNEECFELMTSVGLDTEAKSKDCLLSAFAKFMQTSGYTSNEDGAPIAFSDQAKQDGTRDFRMLGDPDEKKLKVLYVLCMAANEIYKEVKDKVFQNSSARAGWLTGSEGLHSDSGFAFCVFEEQIEKCVLVAGFLNEVWELFGIDLPCSSITVDKGKSKIEGNWASVFQACFCSSKNFMEQMTEVVLPEIIRATLSYNSEVMGAFGCVSQIRGSVDTALEQLMEIEMERDSLMELEQNYYMKVGLITEQQLSLEEAAVRGRDHLSWEEAEELASQEEACRTQLDQLHQKWNQKDMQISSLTRIESSITDTIASTHRYFSSLVSIEQDGDLELRRNKLLLSALVKPFSELEAIDQIISSYGTPHSDLNLSSFSVEDTINSSSVISEALWKCTRLLKSDSFFIWEVGILDSVLGLCLHDISSADQNVGFDQLYNVLKKKLKIHLLELVGRYIIERVAPAFLVLTEKEVEILEEIIGERKELFSEQERKDVVAVRRVQFMLEEYCNAHETARAARSAISAMKKQVIELTESLRRTILEIVQMEWLHDPFLPQLLKGKVFPQNVVDDDKLTPMVLNLSRHNLLERLKSSVSTLAKSMECLHGLARNFASAEGQLEKAMGWACAGPSATGTGNSVDKSSGIPSIFHEHLLKRRQLLCAAREQASDIIKICTSVTEFEASRDGLFQMPKEKSCRQTTDYGKTWQQAYMNALTRLDITYHSFTRAEKDWKLAQSSLEAAAKNLFTATSELNTASLKAKSASGDLQAALSLMQDHAKAASMALSEFSRVSRGRTALTSECGSMLEEVLAITESLPDLYTLGKEAATAHNTLMEDLSKANVILSPLEASLSTDMAVMTDEISKDEGISVDIPLNGGEALYRSYYYRITEACQVIEPVVNSLICSVKDLHFMLTKLARASSLRAGNLHKAVEGLGESQVVKSRGLLLTKSENSDGAVLYGKGSKIFLSSDRGSTVHLEIAPADFSSEGEGWISPLEHTCTGSSNSSITSMDESVIENFDMTEQLLQDNSPGEAAPCVSSTRTDGLEKVSVGNLESQSAEVEESVTHSLTGAPAPGQTIQDLPYDPRSIKVTGSGAIASLNSGESIEVTLSVNEPTTTDACHSDDGAKTFSSMKEVGSSKVLGRLGEKHDDPSCTESTKHAARGKNAFALSVLRQIELKLEGKDNELSRPRSVSELVDLLIKQATSVDNLCNMYEGWTPWI